MWNSQLETLTRFELERLQLSRLRETLVRVYNNVPFYKQLLDEAKFHPDGLRGLEDVERLPFSRKADLRENYPFGLFAVPMAQISRIHASSGTKGKPTVVGYTKNDIDVWAEIAPESGSSWSTAGRRRSQQLRLRALHRRARFALRG